MKFATTFLLNSVVPMTTFLLAYFLADIFFYFFGLAQPFNGVQEQRISWRQHILIFSAILFGMIRLAMRYPTFIPPYVQCLRTLPWNERLPLPLGPLALTWKDAVPLTLLCGLAQFNCDLNFQYPIIAFLGSYLLAGILGLATMKSFAVCAIMLFGVGCFCLVDPNQIMPYTGLAAAMYIVFYLGLMQALRRFPWNPDAEIAMRERRKAPLLGWPFRHLSPVDSAEGMTYRAAFIIAMLIGWEIFCVANQIDFQHNGSEDFAVTFAIIVGTAAAIVRVLQYVVEYPPPISIFGRLFLGRPVIPKYDVVFIGPILTFLAAYAGANLMRHLHASPALTAAVPVGLSMLLVFCMPPSSKRWHLTGEHRIAFRRSAARDQRRLNAPKIIYVKT